MVKKRKIKEGKKEQKIIEWWKKERKKNNRMVKERINIRAEWERGKNIKEKQSNVFWKFVE